jgi:DNA-binding Lrp family transcriptional regulator
MIAQTIAVLLASPVKAPGELSDIGEWILSYVKKKGRVSNRTIAKIRGCSSASAKREAKKLTDRGLIVLRGKGRGAVYESL